MENTPNDVPEEKDIESHGFFSILDQFPQIGQTKVTLFHPLQTMPKIIVLGQIFHWCRILGLLL